VSFPSIFVSTNDLSSVQNSLNSLLALQNASTGMLPYAGYPFNDLGIVSFTYHLYSLIGISYYYQYSGDLTYLQSVWSNFTRGLGWSLSYIDSSGLMNVTSAADWLRVGMGGHVRTLDLPSTRANDTRILKQTQSFTTPSTKVSVWRMSSTTRPPLHPGPPKPQPLKQQPTSYSGTPQQDSTPTTKPQLCHRKMETPGL
jgi:hypothetical protein